MSHNDAVELIRKGVDPKAASVWADLGCGDGTFTKALAEILHPKSEIHAVDKNKDALEHLPPIFNKVRIHSHHLDFEKQEIPISNPDGILMANALHFINDKETLIHKLDKSLRDGGRFLLIEYDIQTGNPWVPFPLPFDQAHTLLINRFGSIEKLSEHPSIYHRGTIYSALIKK